MCCVLNQSDHPVNLNRIESVFVPVLSIVHGTVAIFAMICNLNLRDILRLER